MKLDDVSPGVLFKIPDYPDYAFSRLNASYAVMNGMKWRINAVCRDEKCRLSFWELDGDEEIEIVKEIPDRSLLGEPPAHPPA